jgi:hypothetical protein
MTEIEIQVEPVSPYEDSYATLSEAEVYLASHPFYSVWDAAGSEAQEQALIRATKAIDRLPLSGAKYDSDQTLEFPRVPEEYISVDPWPLEVAEDYSEVPQRVIDACCEEALAILRWGTSMRLANQQRGVSSISLGAGVSESYVGGAGRGLLSQEARELMSPWIARSVPIR